MKQNSLKANEHVQKRKLNVFLELSFLITNITGQGFKTRHRKKNKIFSCWGGIVYHIAT